jgi:hypothetical protein
MAILERFDPPAYLPDFAGFPALSEQWHVAVSNWFDFMIGNQVASLPPGEPVQFYNPAKFDPGGPVVEQAITWNAFPKELLRRYGRERGLREADMLYPLSRYSPRWQGPSLDRTPYRPLNEYCEWHVSRDSDTNKILRVAFSSEPPEYWKALYGGTYKFDDEKEYTFSGSPERVLELYREMVSPDVQPDDIICQETIIADDGTVFANKGEYNPYNKWNTTHGIVHLCSPPNSLTAEIGLGADATILRKNSRGLMLAEPDALVCCAAYGGPDRNSDPTIGAAVNALARFGAYVTLRNPVGLYIDHVDIVGWEAPGGHDVVDCVRAVRGGPGMIERLVIEVPPSWGFTVSDIKIGGVPIMYGGQIAECITVKLVGLAVPANLKNTPAACAARCCIDANNATLLERAVRYGQPTPPGKQPAFVNQGAAGIVALGADKSALLNLDLSVAAAAPPTEATPPLKPRRNQRAP